MEINFTQDLLTGNDRIDDQHREWFSKLDNFWRAAKHGKANENVLNTLLFLQQYVKFHFADEESLQLEVGYPNYQAQKREHDRFINEIDDLIDTLQKKGAGFPVTVDTLNSMMEWVVKHIITMDKDLALFIKSKQGERSTSENKANMGNK